MRLAINQLELHFLFVVLSLLFELTSFSFLSKLSFSSSSILFSRFGSYRVSTERLCARGIYKFCYLFGFKIGFFILHTLAITLLIAQTILVTCTDRLSNSDILHITKSKINVNHFFKIIFTKLKNTIKFNHYNPLEKQNIIKPHIFLYDFLTRTVN